MDFNVPACNFTEVSMGRVTLNYYPGTLSLRKVYEFHLKIGHTYRKTSTISRTLVGNKIVDNSDAVGASPVGAAPTTSSFSI